MKKENPWIIKTDEDIWDFIVDLQASLKEGQMRFDSEDKMTCFLVSYLYQMIRKDDMFGDVIYIREEVHSEEWEDDSK